MALPIGVTTATITFGVPVSFTGAFVRSTVSIQPSAALVHTATGTPLVNFIEDVITTEGTSGQFTLPHTDQTGFQDEAGNAYQNWYYTATITYSSDKGTLPARTKTFQLTSGQTVVDLDLLSAGAPVLPYTAQTAIVSSVAGLTGAVTSLDVINDADAQAALNATYGTPKLDKTEAAATYSPLRLLAAATDLNLPVSAGVQLAAIGVTTTGVFLLQNGSILRWSPNKGTNLYNATLPASTSEPQFIYEWNGYVYGIFKDTTDSLYKVYRAVSPTESVPGLTWSAALHTLTAGSHASAPSITGTASALVICEQGDPLVGGTKEAHIWRTTNGTTFTAAKTLPSTYRHFHCVAADPFNPGHIWATSGDNVDNCFHQSTDHGATWTDVASSMTFQSVQISFTASKIYFAPDALGQAPLYTMDRTTKQLKVGAYGSYRQLRVIDEGVYNCGNTTNASTTFNTSDAVFSSADVGRKIVGPGIPNGATISAYTSTKQVTLSVAATATASNIKFIIERAERPFGVAFVGAVDPATGIYYGVTNNEVGGWNANTGVYARPVMFMIPYPGGPVVGLGELSSVTSPAVFISQGYVWFGSYYRPLITL